jgi:hypothetical protein
MSNTKAWLKHAETYKYSQDDRTKQWKYEKELTPEFNRFLDDNKQNSMVVGQYNLKLEPWRLAAIISFRKYNLKISKKNIDDDITEIIVTKQKMQK